MRKKVHRGDDLQRKLPIELRSVQFWKFGTRCFGWSFYQKEKDKRPQGVAGAVRASVVRGLQPLHSPVRGGRAVEGC